MPYGIANYKGKVSKVEVETILNFAYKAGINTIDTATGYGNSENIIGHHLKKHVTQKWFIITKVSGSKDKLYDQLSQSIDKLGATPSGVLAHSIDDYLGTIFCDKPDKIKKKFLIEKIGVSIYEEEHIDRVLAAKTPDIIQCPLNILDTRLYRNGILDKMKANGLEIHVRSVFLQGMFYLPDKILQQSFRDVLPTIRKLRTIAQNADLTLAELSLMWVCSLEQVDKVIIGVDNVEQLMDHIKTLNKNINTAIFEEALSIKYENENILNPSLWETIS
jgi:aryl-alcohol dehydrogenase-like predicted oxidoreductase|tara:strand:+ start:98 stop:925 length:828 start_codon:yes stop_codon:yes gene_type:complete